MKTHFIHHSYQRVFIYTSIMTMEHPPPRTNIIRIDCEKRKIGWEFYFKLSHPDGLVVQTVMKRRCIVVGTRCQAVSVRRREVITIIAQKCYYCKPSSFVYILLSIHVDIEQLNRSTVRFLVRSDVPQGRWKNNGNFRIPYLFVYNN